jgi:hypothetical protein
VTDTKRPYQTPKLVEWGTVVDLTQVSPSCAVDSAFSGSVPCGYPVDQTA